MRVSVDVGGTFTDVIVLDEDSGDIQLDKVATTPANPAEGVLEGFDKVGAQTGDIEYFVHGTTLGINAMLTRSGAKVAFVTTRGFRDIYVLGRTDREPMYDFKYKKPKSLVPRSLCFEVTGRLNYKGQVLIPFDADQAREVAQRIVDQGVESVAVCFLHSYANPAHELAFEKVFQEVAPQISVTLSHRLSRVYREYERSSTTVIDAYIKPITRTYLTRLNSELVNGGFNGNFLMTRSGGGAMTLDTAREEPAHLVLSGPAGGVIGGAFLGKLIDLTNMITVDMGGTSLDASLIAEGEPTVENEQVFQTLPISIPTIDIHTIGAGGGSIAWVDEGGHLQVGPQSAGADPGPACYNKDGQQATFTDAALQIGFLNPDNFLGGEIDIDPALAEAAIERLAQQLGMGLNDVAAGIVSILEAKMAGAVRVISVERGYHPRDFALCAFGGGGAFVAANISRELGVPLAIIPPGPGNFSALGMLMVDVVHDYARTHITGLVDMDPAQANQVYTELAAQGQAALASDGFGADQQQYLPSAEMRYRGQEHTVNIPLPGVTLSTDDIPLITERFHAAHLQQYGHSMMQDPIEIVTLRLRAVGLLPRPDLARAETGSGNLAAASRGSRMVYDRASSSQIEYQVYDRMKLGAGDSLSGPAIVEEPSSTTMVHTGDALTVGDYGELQIRIAQRGDNG
ncbi:MAG: hydantoinase/oxoprolinase family protein [Anaerolineaceae bacterium]|nr:hydantoinase/oxoprolinase family protein [Anaerolineaceae bacterium]MDE0328483.1 hydantoinase/oxoprolinase family protein [Anaerolineaceae bacterium]